jgi:uncharacterized protein YybS (DUF2232 family)
MRNTATDIRNLILLGVAAVAAGFIAPSLPFLGLPLAAFALSWITYRFGLSTGVGISLLAAVLVAVFGPALGLASTLDSLFVVAALIVVGPATAVALQRFPAFAVLLGVAVALTGAFLLTPIGPETLSVLIAQVPVLLKSGIVSAGSGSTAATAATVVQLYRQSWPWIIYYLMGLSALVCVPAASRAARSLDVTVRHYPKLADVDVTFHVVWPTILGIAALAVGTFTKNALASAVGLNALMFVRPVLAVQGLGDFAALYRRAKAGRLAQGLGYVLLVLTEIIIPSVSVLGLVDLFFNLRKLPRGGATSSAGMARP